MVDAAFEHLALAGAAGAAAAIVRQADAGDQAGIEDRHARVAQEGLAGIGDRDPARVRTWLLLHRRFLRQLP